MHINNLQEVKHLVQRYSIMKKMTEGTPANVKMSVAGEELFFSDEDFLSGFQELLTAEIEKTEAALDELGVKVA